MPNTKISALAALDGGSVDSAADLLPIVDTDVAQTKKLTIDGLGTALTATQAEQEAATSLTRFVSPGRQKFHPSAAKFWIKFSGGGTPAASASYNLTSITDNGVGDWTLVIDTDFSSANWCAVTGIDIEANSVLLNVWTNGQAAGTVGIRAGRASGTGSTTIEFYDSGIIYVAGFGDQ